MAASRYICIAENPQGATVSFPCAGNSVSLATVRSHFPRATGLKYIDGSNWVAVTLEKETFKLPDEDHMYIVVSGAIDSARTILNNRNLTSQLSTMFKPRPVFATEDAPFPSRKAVRATYKSLKKNKPYSKTYKVIFITETVLPVAFSRSLVVLEGFLTIENIDNEDTIINKLEAVLSSCSTNYSNCKLKFLTYMSKTLSMPVTPPGFTWGADNVKANVGQGKLYMMVTGVEPEMQCSDEADEETMVEATSRNAVSNKDGKQGFDEWTSEQDVSASASANWRKPEQSQQEAELKTVKTTEVKPQIGEPSMAEKSTVLPPSDTEGDDTGTPTVTFHPRHRRNRLSLRQVAHENDVPSNFRHRSYVGLIEDVHVITSSDEEETDPFKETNLESKNVFESSERKLFDILQELSTKVIERPRSTKINVTRANPMEGMRRAISRSTFDPTTQLSVKFADDFGTSEGAVDMGGPTRELFRLLLKQISELSVFHGTDSACKTLILNGAALSDRLYKDIGVIFTMAVIHGGQFPSILSKISYNMIVNDKVDCNLQDITDSELKAVAKKLQDATSVENIQQIMEENSTLFQLSGCYVPFTTFSVEKRDKLVRDFVQFLVVGRNLPAVQQLRTGLATFGFLEMIQKNPRQFAEVFCFLESRSLTAEQMEAIFTKVEWSEPGSNRRRTEEMTLTYWRDYLIDIEESTAGITFQDLLVFATGASQIPYLGFTPDPSIEFIHEGGDRRFCQANTCSMVLRLPITTSYGEFKENMDFGILNSPGFGMA